MKKRINLLFIVGLLFVLLVFVGTVFYMAIEGWSFVDSLYFTVVTITTIGYGDLTPTHNVSKILTVCFILVSIPLMFAILSIIIENFFESRIRRLEERLSAVAEEEREIEEIVEKEGKELEEVIGEKGQEASKN